MASAIKVVTNIQTGAVESVFTQSADDHLIQWVPPTIGINKTADWQAWDINALTPGSPLLAP